MRRLGRIVLTGVMALSLLMALLAAASWVRSYWRSDQVLFVSQDEMTERRVLVTRGRVLFTIDYEDQFVLGMYGEKGFHHYAGSSLELPPLGSVWLGLGWDERRGKPPSASRYREATIPHAYFIGLFALLPAIRLYRWFRRPRLIPAGHCFTCGYDLRASLDRCPECGTVPPDKEDAKR